MRIVHYIGLMCLLIAIISITTHAQEKDEPATDIIAYIGDEPIRSLELQSVLSWYREYGNTKLALETLTPEGKERILNEIIDRRLLSYQAKTQGLHVVPEIEYAIKNAVEKILSENLVKIEIAKLDLSESGLKKFYEQNYALFTSGARVKVRHVITLSKKSAEEALAQIESGREFDFVAREYNIDKSKLNGGDLGWVAKGIMVKSFEEALFSLEEGESSDIVKSSFGYHIIKAEAIDRGKLKPFESVKADIRMQIIDQHISILKARLREAYPVKINQKLLEKWGM